MENKKITFDEVFKIWLDAEVSQVEGRNILPVAQAKGFSSIAEWRLASALRMGLDKKEWTLETIDKPEEVLPSIIVGPYQGWSVYFENKINTSFKQALDIPEFLEWCKGHDRIVPISENFPQGTTVILLRKENGDLVHIEGGHRICAVAYSQKIGKPVQFTAPVTAAISSITDDEIENLLNFLKEGTFKKTP